MSRCIMINPITQIEAILWDWTRKNFFVLFKHFQFISDLDFNATIIDFDNSDYIHVRWLIIVTNDHNTNKIMISTICHDSYELFTGPENEFRILFQQILTNSLTVKIYLKKK